MSDTQEDLARAIALRDEKSLENINHLSKFNTDIGGAPLMLAMLTQLGMISALGTDFSLVSEGNNDEILARLKTPGSFRASLAQVCNEAFDALRKAHVNMDYLELAMGKIPQKVKNIAKLLTQGTDRDIEDFLGDDLGDILNIAQQGEDKVQEVVAKFDEVIATLHAIDQATQATRKAREGVKAHNEEKHEFAIIAEKQRREEIIKVEAELAAMKVQAANEQLEFSKTLDTMGDNLEKARKATTQIRVGGWFWLKWQTVPAYSEAQLAQMLDEKNKVMRTQQAQIQAKERLLSDLKDRSLRQVEQLMEILKDNSRIKASQATNEQVLDIISKGLQAMNQLKQQWTQLSIFFSKMKNILQLNLFPNLKQLESISNKVGGRRKEEGDAISQYIRDRMQQSVMEMIGTGSVIHIMAGSYTRLSNGHLMPMIEQFGAITSMTRERNMAALDEQWKEMWPVAMKAQEEVKRIIEEGHLKYRVWLEEDKKEVEGMFNNALALDQSGQRQMLGTN